MSVKLIVRKKEYQVRSGLTVKQALKQLGLRPEAYLTTRAGEMLTEDEVLREGDEVNVVAVISGGRG